MYRTQYKQQLSCAWKLTSGGGKKTKHWAKAIQKTPKQNSRKTQSQPAPPLLLDTLSFVDAENCGEKLTFW